MPLFLACNELMNEGIFRPMAFAVHKILQSMYQGVHVNEHQLQHVSSLWL